MLTRARILRILLVFLISILLILFLAARLFILSSFENLEQSLVQTQVERVNDALAERLDALSSKTGDWATWDESYSFVAGDNPEFAEREITDASMAQLKINLIMFINLDGTVVYSHAFDLVNQRTMPFEYANRLNLDNFFHRLTPASRLSGIVLLPDAPLLIAARPVLNSEGQGPVNGVLVFGRFLDNVEIANLATTTHLTLKFSRLDQTLATEDLRLARQNLALNQTTFVRALDDRTIAGYGLLADIDKQPALLLQVDVARDVYQHGWTSVLYFILAIAAIASVFAALVLILGERLIKSQEGQRESERLYYTLAEAAPDAIYVVDAQHRIKYANETATRQFSRRWSSIVGEPQSRYYPDEPGNEVYKVLESGRAIELERQIEFHENTAWFDIRMVPLAGDRNAHQMVLGIARDITARKENEAQIERQLLRLNALHSIDQAITSGLDLKFTLNVVLAQTRAQLYVDAADILLLNPFSQTLSPIVNAGFDEHYDAQRQCTLNDALAGRAVLKRQTTSLVALHLADGKLDRADLLAANRFVSGFATPLIARGQVRGVLQVFNRTRFDPDQEWLDFLQTLAGQAAIAVDSIETFENLQRSNTELAQAYDTTLEGWTRALDMRDNQTAGHTNRVADLTVRLARTFGKSDTELVHIRRGALLHDIGKMAIPDTVLLKPGRLTEDEWQIMRKHPAYAYDMLSSIQYLNHAIEIPYCHHEKWDGTGYPRGLKGDNIPFSARVFAVVDVWDALRSNRPYRPEWSAQETARYICEEAGKQFDPVIVAAFLKLISLEEGIDLSTLSVPVLNPVPMLN